MSGDDKDKGRIAEVISLVDRLRQNGKQNGAQSHAPSQSDTSYYDGKYPIFEGKVFHFGAEIRCPDGTFSVLDYVPCGKELPTVGFSTIIGDGLTQYKETISKIVERAIVPFSVHPETVTGANVKGYMDTLEGRCVYILEVLKDETITETAKALGALAGHPTGHKYEGFKYILILPQK